MTASIGTDLVVALGIGAGVAAVTVPLLVLIGYRQQNRAMRLARAAAGADLLSLAARAAENDTNDLVHQVLEGAVADVSQDLGLSSGLVRASLFVIDVDSHAMRIAKGQTVNFERDTEKEIVIRPGETGVGESAEQGQPVITTFRSSLQESTVQDLQRDRADPDLRWVISVPIPPKPGSVAWVLAVDGLVEPRTSDQLRPSVIRLLYYQELLELILRERTKAS